MPIWMYYLKTLTGYQILLQRSLLAILQQNTETIKVAISFFVQSEFLF